MLVLYNGPSVTSHTRSCETGNISPLHNSARTCKITPSDTRFASASLQQTAGPSLQQQCIFPSLSASPALIAAAVGLAAAICDIFSSQTHLHICKNRQVSSVLCPYCPCCLALRNQVRKCLVGRGQDASQKPIRSRYPQDDASQVVMPLSPIKQVYLDSAGKPVIVDVMVGRH